MEIHTKHHSGMRVRSLISSDYTKWLEEYEKKKAFTDPNIIDPIKTLKMHRMYYPEYPLFQMTEDDW
jgi:DNA-binding MltR family transcriptional regulator